MTLCLIKQPHKKFLLATLRLDACKENGTAGFILPISLYTRLSSKIWVMYLRQIHQVQSLNESKFLAVRELTRLSKNLYNVALYTLRQYFLKKRQHWQYEFIQSGCEVFVLALGVKHANASHREQTFPCNKYLTVLINSWRGQSLET
jgi:hypothetical protein